MGDLYYVRLYPTFCKSGKVRYHNKVTARITLGEAQYKRYWQESRQEQRVYLCHLCNGWHLTSAPLREDGERTGRPRLSAPWPRHGERPGPR